MKERLNRELPLRTKKNEDDTEVGLSDLMLAVLDDALRTYRDGFNSPIPAKRVESFKVEVWVNSDDTDWPFAFVNVCNSVGISPDYVRSRLEQWRRNAVGHNNWVH